MKSGMDGPYPGPRPFRQADRGVFFGRDGDAKLLADWWRTNNLTYAVGPAGRGKTSLLHAGIWPLLTNGQHKVLPPGSLSFGAAFPLTALPAHNPYQLALLRSWSAGEAATKLAGLSVRDFVGAIPGSQPILAAIDPIDELAGSGGARQRHRRDFLAELSGALSSDPRLHLLIVGREQAIALAAQVLGNGLRHEIRALTGQQAVEAVSGPMMAAGRRFADGAAEKLVKELMTSRLAGRNGAEQYVTADLVEPPLLQMTCAHLWGSLPPDGSPVTIQDVRSYADVDQALTAWTSAVISQVADDFDLSPKRLATWLAEAFITEIGTRGRQYEGVSATALMPNVVAASLEDRHLLTSSVQSSSRWYELISDRLVEPVRQLAATLPSYDLVERGDDGTGDRLLTAERALAAGELELAKRQATTLLRHVTESRTRSSSEGFALLGGAYSLLGNVACETGRPEEAEKQFREAMRHFAAASDSQAVGYQLTAIGQLLLEQDQADKAVDAFAGAVTRVPNDLAIRVFYATALWQLGQSRAAVAVLTDALSIDGDHTGALLTRGEILADLGEAREAMRDLDRVPGEGRPVTRAARGLALAELGQRQAARREIEEAIEGGERSGPALLYAARAFALIGDMIASEEIARLAADATDPPLSWRQRETARKLVSQGS